MAWIITVVDVNGVTWEHRVVFDPSDRVQQWFGVENLHSYFKQQDWMMFLANLITMMDNGPVNTVNNGGERSQVSWRRDD